MDSKTLSDLIGLIYDTAVDEKLWPRLLQMLSEELEPLLDEDQKSDSASEMALTDILRSHFTRALDLNREILEARSERNAMERLFEHLPLGMMVVDSEGQVLSCNRQLSQIVSEGKELSVNNNILSAGSSIDTIRLRKVIRAVANNEEPEGKTIHMSSAEGSTPLSAMVLPFRSGLASNTNIKNKVVLLVAAPEIRIEISTETLMSLYRLTGAEAKLVSSLVKDRSLNSIAEDFGVSKHTIRNQLKSVYDKTGTHRQAELVRQVIAGPAMLATLSKKVKTTIHCSLTSRYASSWEKSESRLHQTMKRPDGRQLGYAEYGAPDGRPVMLMHAFNGSRLERHPDENIVRRCGVRLIVADRPGVGLSEVKENLTLTNWADDVDCLADHLKLNEFSVIGYSMGAAFALACAHGLKDRIDHLVLVAGVTPFESIWELSGMYASYRLFLSLGRHAPALIDPLLKLIEPYVTLESFQKELLRNLPPVDQALVSDAAIMNRLMESMRENFRQSGHYNLTESTLITKHWGFDISEIKAPSEIWHGELDRIVPLQMSLKVAKTLPNCKTNFLPGAGHFILFHCWKEILQSAIY
jgi:pimeloyl-ACP methyl ester carboxylesterase/DNA-binding CsgD family transcriptional regulator